MRHHMESALYSHIARLMDQNGLLAKLHVCCRHLNTTTPNSRRRLSLTFGLQRFHAYLFGHRFELVTDHQPLLTLLHQHRPTSTQSSAMHQVLVTASLCVRVHYHSSSNEAGHPILPSPFQLTVLRGTNSLCTKAA